MANRKTPLEKAEFEVAVAERHLGGITRARNPQLWKSALDTLNRRKKKVERLKG